MKIQRKGVRATEACFTVRCTVWGACNTQPHGSQAYGLRIPSRFFDGPFIRFSDVWAVGISIRLGYNIGSNTKTEKTVLCLDGKSCVNNVKCIECCLPVLDTDVI